jgi:hypothetical protein
LNRLWRKSSFSLKLFLFGERAFWIGFKPHFLTLKYRATFICSFLIATWIITNMPAEHFLERDIDESAQISLVQAGREGEKKTPQEKA